MSIGDFVILILGAVLGAVASAWYAASTAALRRVLARHRLRQRTEEDRRGVMTDMLLDYYRRRGLLQNLYRPAQLSTSRPISSTGGGSWLSSKIVDLHKDQFLYLDGTAKDHFAVDRRLIRQRRAQGARIFDGEILYLKKKKELRQADDGSIQSIAGNCDYLSYATLSLRLEAELRSRLRRTPLHDRHFQDAGSASTTPALPLGIGGSGVTVFRSRNEYYVALQTARRGHESRKYSCSCT